MTEQSLNFDLQKGDVVLCRVLIEPNFEYALVPAIPPKSALESSEQLIPSPGFAIIKRKVKCKKQ